MRWGTTAHARNRLVLYSDKKRQKKIRKGRQTNADIGVSISIDFDFMPIGQAIKKAREAKKVTREQLAEIVDYSARHIQSVENEGQHPSFELFIQLITMFDVSVDEYIFPNKKTNKSSVRRRLETLLDNLDDKELSVIEATVNGLCKAKEPEE